MITSIVDLSQRRAARVAGVLYLLLIIFGVAAEGIRQSLIVTDDAAETAQNIMDSEGLYRLSFTSDIFMILSFVLLPLAFYILFKPVNKHLASLVVIFVLVSVPIMLVNMVFHYSALVVLGDADHLAAFDTDQLHALMMVFLDLYTTGVVIATIFHGLWLFPLGYLVYKSGYFPQIFGILLMLACFGFLIESFQHFLAPDAEVITYPGMVVEIIGEFGFCAWLLIKGAKISSMDAG